MVPHMRGLDKPADSRQPVESPQEAQQTTEQAEQAFFSADEDVNEVKEEKEGKALGPVAVPRPRLPQLPPLTRSSETHRYLALVERVLKEELVTDLDRTSVKLHVISFIENPTVRDLAHSVVELRWAEFRSALARSFSNTAQLQFDIESRFGALSYDHPLFVNECRSLYQTVCSASAVYRISDSEFITRITSILPAPVLTKLLDRLDVSYPNTFWRTLDVATILYVLEAVCLFSREVSALTQQSQSVCAIRRVQDSKEQNKGGDSIREWVKQYRFVLRVEGVSKDQLAALKTNSVAHRRVNKRGSSGFFMLFGFHGQETANKLTRDLPAGSFREWTASPPARVPTARVDF